MKRDSGAETTRNMPDVASNSMVDHIHSTLDWVGMSEIHLPARVSDTLAGERPISTSIQAYVNLSNPDAKGIHMSRLYLMLEETFGDHSVSAESIELLLKNFLETHDGLSDRGFVQFDFEYSMRRPALKSSYSGWKSYPVTIKGTLSDEGMRIELAVEVPYSSTCPCSAALARQLIQDQFRRDFKEGKVDADTVFEWLGTEQGVVATPHSQRSVAQVRVLLGDSCGQGFPITALIDAIEGALKTPVQTAVKRVDEQEFALLNGQNLMFCEDAARRLKQALDPQECYRDFWLRVNHLESLHAHNAVAIVTKEVDGGYLPIP
ncbi:GTP cyclohydrolase FolE2 [Alloalcanivorax mobilis]|uniref:GTP cyclohydrolase FolE2 n=1 Tax=Alloalcanivorax mobilis TaxID=2019569 RepID=UPI000B5B207C|nr:GTP cyclohydrolase FolE2 [Alloalcanivorax mobilis]ASK35334.1 GTP cyclohydrolase I FolE2 [Alcanivorax sp. N3-2A]|tara:strand:- start:19743 stop:20702 length:960 start_codon:yes stop_codon:yes gene_type:complete